MVFFVMLVSARRRAVGGGSWSCLLERSLRFLGTLLRFFCFAFFFV